MTWWLSLIHIYGCINLHVSLLPKYRGSAPVQWAVLNGDTETGVSIMQMDEGLDTGDVLVCEKIAIGPEETSGELFDRVTAVGARVLCEAVPAMEAGTLKPQPQQHENATLAPMLDKELAEFRLTDTAAHIHNWVRGMNPWPMAWFVTAGGKKVKMCIRDRRIHIRRMFAENPLEYEEKSMILSMTGFGRGTDVRNGREITVELRSVNSRYFEYSSRMPRCV